LQSLVTEARAVLDTATNKAQTHTVQTQALMSQGERDLHTLCDSRTAMDAQHSQTLSQWSVSLDTATKQRVDALHVTRKEGQSTVDALLPSLSTRRTESKSQSASLLGQMEDALTHAQDEINDITVEGERVLEKVKEHDTALRQSIGGKVQDSLTEQSACQSEVAVTVATESKAISELADRERDIVTNIKLEGVQYNECIRDSQLRHRGNTPNSLTIMPERVFVNTRDTNVIRKEVLGEMLVGGDKAEWREKINDLTPAEIVL
jgi:predicted XRE-type DNA-binding protein